MEQYTDDERVDDLKKWWKENGISILAGIGLGVVAIFGWQYWGAHRNSQAEKTSLIYDAFIVAVEKPDAAQARQHGEALLAESPNSTYAALVGLQLAKLALDSGDTNAAGQRLEWVIANAGPDEIKDIARLRLARVQLAAGQQAEAEKTLGQMTTPSLQVQREELKGDLYLASNDLDKARTAYAAALAAGGNNPLLQLKLDHLGATASDAIIPAPPPPPPPTPEPEAAKATTDTAPTTTTPAPAAVPVESTKAAPTSESAETEAAPTSESAETEAAPTSESAETEAAPTSESAETEAAPATAPTPPAEPAPPAEPMPESGTTLTPPSPTSPAGQ